ncbi:MAG: amidohydrolase family protein [Firmicutes bacterium]|nr:amidohydrolase family protein [Bacillota bacterium]
MIIDFHTHTFPDRIAGRVLRSLSNASRTLPVVDGTIGGLTANMKAAGVDFAVNLPVMTRPDQVESLNHKMIENQEALLASGIITFGGMHPDYQDYKQELRLLHDHGIKGIKLHPAYQGRDIDDPAFLRIIEAASELGLIVLTHAGIDIGIYDHNYASVPQILNVLRLVAPDRFVLAHMGGWGSWDRFEADLAGAPLWIDTAFSIGPIPVMTDPPAPLASQNLPMEDAVRIMRKHGTDRVLFATDSPWADMVDYVQMIRESTLSVEEQKQVLGANAVQLLGI